MSRSTTLPAEIEVLERELESSRSHAHTLEQQVRTLDRERQKLAAVVNHTDVGFLSVDPSLRVTWVNKVVVSYFGDPTTTGGMLLGASCHDLLCRRESPCDDCPGRAALKTGAISHGELRLDLAGQERRVYATGIPIRTPGVAGPEAIVMLQDVSGLEILRRSEEALRLKSEHLQAITAAMAGFLQGGDCKAASTLLLRSALRQTSSDYGFAAILLEGPTLKVLADEGVAPVESARARLGPGPGADGRERALERKDLSDFDAAFGRPLSGGQPVIRSAINLAGRLAALLPGHPPIQSFLGVPIRRENEVLGFIGVANRPGGYTEEEQASVQMVAQMAGVLYASYRQRLREEALHEQLRQSQKMEAVGRLAGGVAHDFNNLLTAITCYAELLLQSLGPDDPRSEHAEEVRKAAERAASLTRQLLAFSRKQVIAPKVLDLNVVVADMQPMLQRLLGEHVDLVTTPDRGALCIHADRGQVEQVILNLAVNARDAMPDGGTITMETSRLNLDDANRSVYMRPGPYVALLVKDTGVGMDAETRSHLFEPFFTTKQTGEGTGLGLSTVYAVVRQFGGYIRVTSEPGSGSTFTVYLPENEGGVDHTEPPLPLARSGSETILLVEDEEVVRRAARRILESNGYTVIEAANGKTALRLCLREPGPIHILVTDVLMPQMNGRELADRVRAMRPETPVLYVSGHTDDAILHQGVKAEGLPFLQKPFTPDSLARRVRDVLDTARVPR